MYADRSNKLLLIYDIAKEKSLFPQKVKTVKLESPSQDANPWIALQGGDLYVKVDDDTMTTYGSIVNQNTKLPTGKEYTLHVFRIKGETDRGLAGQRENIWCIDKGKPPVLLATNAYRTVQTAEGEKRTLLMKKGSLTDDQWVGDLGGKIVVEKEGEQLSQIGWAQWRRIILEDGNPMIIMMAKGMGSSAKWRGRYNGVCYEDK
jgi:hypothetical protein